MCMHSDGQQITRRTVLAGAAWSVPITVLAVATPAAAASAVDIDMVWSDDRVAQAGYQVNNDGSPFNQPVDQQGQRLVTITPSGAELPVGTVISFAAVRIDGGSQAAPPLVFSGVAAPGISVGALGASTLDVTLTAPVADGASLSLQVDLVYGTTVLPSGSTWYAAPTYSVSASVDGVPGLQSGYWRGSTATPLVTRYGTVFGYGSF